MVSIWQVIISENQVELAYESELSGRKGYQLHLERQLGPQGRFI